ncbi:MAG: DUF4202 domain-containing protein [Acidimicrobiaceae bacterium]|nr:DUF4202 domain-containing protein [Acidimicrobiaceae bacterium]MXW60530.1 DUF4202 domain-containing protein [Acidimicrobiaceae bacterium]MXW74630.1 DUF4202 domain-containing protein [Acidimicrobiaceae bacterium]MYA73340.1 DUF4202 domain-containing protein [Acidimicrobiaceae bacterium]MYC43513.1 DUF4202 domain-containing protein [Acidimicrobiaceae bacterium]
MDDIGTGTGADAGTDTEIGARMQDLRAAIDAVNAGDPRVHDTEPLALAQGRMAEAWVALLAPDASVALRLAARAHHLSRWELPRSDYPDVRAGYLRWRRAQRQRHGHDLIAILDAAGAQPSVSARAAEVVTKKGLGSDPEVQTFEDAVSLAFLETELLPVVDRLEDDSKVTDIVAKTLAKMSAAGREQAQELAAVLDERSRMIVAEAQELFAERHR